MKVKELNALPNEVAVRSDVAVGAKKGVQLVTAPIFKVHELRAWLSEAQRRGEIREAWGWEEDRTHIYVWIERIKEPRSRTPTYIAVTTAVLGAVVAVSVMLWEVRFLLLAAAILAGAVSLGIFVTNLLPGGKSCSCVVHGPTCR